MAVRSALFKLYFFVISAVMMVGLAPLLLAPRGAITWAMRQWAKLTLFGLKTIAGIGLELRGTEHIPPGRALIASKHLSMFETIAFHLLLADPALIMKRELSRIPLYGQFARRAKMIVVDRDAGAKALRRMLNEAKARLGENRQIVIFPEGTRHAPGAPPDYKSGVAALYTHLGVACVPVALNSGLFWPKSGPLPRRGTIIIEFLPAIPSGLARGAFMAALEQAIEPATLRLLAQVPGAGFPQPVGKDVLPVDNAERNIATL
jgi:1-acyl-sn-glycerol-3-phosphate acyltransferase